MASEQSASANGTYGVHQGSSFGTSEQTSTATTSGTGASTSPAEIPKDEVGWYFVEQYYTTLSRSPDKLYLFYNKRSQFVYGEEEEKVQVSVGKENINERILSLDFQDIKVRITNVDSQGADQHIVIQVIGEISTKLQPHRKFVQTFILASQTSGYFVLNDIFRYIAEGDVEAEEEGATEQPAGISGTHEPAPTATEPAGETLANDNDSSAREEAAAKVDKELEEVAKTESGTVQDSEIPAAAQVNGTSADETSVTAEEEEAPIAPISTEEKPSAEAEEPKVEQVKESEKPKEPEAAKPAPKAAAPSGPPRPAVPKTWANLAAAANRTPAPVKSAVQNAASTAASVATSAANAVASALPSVPTAPAAASKPAPSAPATQREASPANSGDGSASGWQTAGADHSKRQSRTIAPNAPTEESSGNRGFIKNVYEAVSPEALKQELSKYGEVVYLDISRPKNCAFIEFATNAGFKAAVEANPHKIGEETIVVEERRIRGPINGPFRGGPQRGGRGDGRPTGQGRGGFPRDQGRGGMPSRGRGGPQGARGRGATPSS